MDVLTQYYKEFGKFPFLLQTMSYKDDDYELLMLMAIARGTPLTEEEISEHFQGQYDVVSGDNKQFTNFSKQDNIK